MLRMVQRRGDTLVEVMIAISIFAIVCMVVISMMQSGLRQAQTALEVTMARKEIDAQAEAVRFIHNAYLSEKELSPNPEYQDLWRALIANAIDGKSSNTIPPLATNDCRQFYQNHGQQAHLQINGNNQVFIINSRNILANDVPRTVFRADRAGLFMPSALYPRLVFGHQPQGNSDTALVENNLDFRLASGVWMFAVHQSSDESNRNRPPSSTNQTNTPEYYDFHIRTCWNSASSKNPFTIGTIIRLYNPDLIEAF